MTRDERVYHYQNLLILCTIPFIVVALHQISMRVDIKLPEPRECKVFHEHAPIHLKCQN